MIQPLLNDEVILRLILAFLIGLGGFLAFSLYNRLILARVSNKMRTLGVKDRSGSPMLVYFTTPTCAPCKTVQRPAIHRLQELVGERLQVIEIDASANPELAQQWGVMSVPTTFVIGQDGEPRFVNHGVVNAEKLLRQLQAVHQE